MNNIYNKVRYCTKCGITMNLIVNKQEEIHYYWNPGSKQYIPIYPDSLESGDYYYKCPNSNCSEYYNAVYD